MVLRRTLHITRIDVGLPISCKCKKGKISKAEWQSTTESYKVTCGHCHATIHVTPSGSYADNGGEDEQPAD